MIDEDPPHPDYSSMLVFYMKKDEPLRTSNAFETAAAIKAADIIADEIGTFRRAR